MLHGVGQSVRAVAVPCLKKLRSLQIVDVACSLVAGVVVKVIAEALPCLSLLTHVSLGFGRNVPDATTKSAVESFAIVEGAAARQRCRDVEWGVLH